MSRHEIVEALNEESSDSSEEEELCSEDEQSRTGSDNYSSGEDMDQVWHPLSYL